MKSVRLIIACALAVASGAGCTLTRVCNSDGGIEIMRDENGKTDVRIDDICFRDCLAVEDITLCRNSGGILMANVVVRNNLVDRYDYNRMDKFSLQYKATWFDANGMSILPDLSLWMREDFGGGDSKSLALIAPTKEATRFVLRMKHVR